ncbi:hypothetical protein ANN_22765 [Periplaneta americana]|uniref:Uncharacterized protein n=1 Tax=Periplaneta americana TaxID=6978 RepID=A0ABQ8SJD4_PERAM|nr:hypothetical protein ANN_22765 [Periplaneta americana]
MDLREVGYDDRDWINLAQDRDRCRAYIQWIDSRKRCNTLQKHIYQIRLFFCPSVDFLCVAACSSRAKAVLTQQEGSPYKHATIRQCRLQRRHRPYLAKLKVPAVLPNYSKITVASKMSRILRKSFNMSKCLALIVLRDDIWRVEAGGYLIFVLRLEKIQVDNQPKRESNPSPREAQNQQAKAPISCATPVGALVMAMFLIWPPPIVSWLTKKSAKLQQHPVKGHPGISLDRFPSSQVEQYGVSCLFCGFHVTSSYFSQKRDKTAQSLAFTERRIEAGGENRNAT